VAKGFRGISGNQEVRASAVIRDVRPIWKQLTDALLERKIAAVTFGVMGIFNLIFSSIADVVLVVELLIFWYSFWHLKALPFRLPIFAKKLDPNNPPIGSVKPGKAQGIFFLGNDLQTNEQLWFTDTDMRTHMLIFGTTGSGKTQTLISLSFNALMHGSGFIYVDGKGDNSLYAQIFSMVRSMGREDDLLVVNFMTGAADIIGPQEKVLSNTMNPFSAGSSSMLSNLVVSLMDSGGGNQQSGDMWKGRAIAFIDALMRPLVWMRDQGFLLLEAATVRRYFSLDVLEELLYDRKVVDQVGNVTVMDKPLPFDVRDSLENYLATLPGYQKSEKGKQSGKAYEQHGYITMQLTRIFGSLADVYGHIVRTKLAEVDFKDIILNRRILVVLLPALEKSPDELAQLGKLIIASLRAMLASGLGDRIEGEYKDVIETKPTNSKVPFLCILDEYGYYAVKGFAVVPAQARSLGFSVIFAGQDLPAFQKDSKEEAASITANTNIKICMKLEDPMTTWEFFQKAAGETYVAAARSFAAGKEGMDTSYRDSGEAQFDKRARVDLLDLKDQREGEMHVFFQSKIVRAKTFYAGPKKVKTLKLNQMLKVEGPSNQAVKFLTVLRGKQFDVKKLERKNMEEPLKPIFDLLDKMAKKEDSIGIYQTLNRFLSGAQEEEVVEFGDQSTNPSIFMSVPIDVRLASDFFDVEISILQESILTKEKLYEVVKKLSILEGRSEGSARKEANQIIARLEKETDYGDCMPKSEGEVLDLINQFIEQVTT
jgi:intracellular multiplication protein IcmO